MSAVMTESAPRHPDGKRRKNGCMKTQRALFWFGSAALGALGGLALGQVAIGEGLYGKLTGASAATSFAEYSSNPLAATVDSLPAPLPLDRRSVVSGKSVQVVVVLGGGRLIKKKT